MDVQWTCNVGRLGKCSIQCSLSGCVQLGAVRRGASSPTGGIGGGGGGGAGDRWALWYERMVVSAGVMLLDPTGAPWCGALRKAASTARATISDT